MSDTTTPTITKNKRKTRRKNNVAKEIKLYQEKHFGTLIPVSCMRRVITDQLPDGFRLTSDAQKMLQTEAENVIVEKLKKANRLAHLCKRDTVTAEDLKNVEFFET